MKPKRIQELREIFEKHKYYTTYELAGILNVHPDTINLWRRKCGVSSGRPKIPSTPRAQKKEYVIIPPEIWSNKEWLKATYESGVGIASIAKMVGRSKTAIRIRLKRYGIPIRSFEEASRTKNPYCNKQWLIDNYITKEYPLAKCAGLANVTSHTICKWLARFRIPIRDGYEARHLVHKRKNATP